MIAMIYNKSHSISDYPEEPQHRDNVLEYLCQSAALGMFLTLTKLAQLHLSSSAASVPVQCTLSSPGLVTKGNWSNL